MANERESMIENGQIVIHPKDIAALYEEAIALRAGYLKENKAVKGDARFDPGSVDDVAVRLFERYTGTLATGMGLNNRGGTKNVLIAGHEGSVIGGDPVFGPGVETMLMKDYSDPLVARFALKLCETLEHRSNNGCDAIKAVMPANVGGRLRTTRKHVGPYARA